MHGGLVDPSRFSKSLKLQIPILGCCIRSYFRNHALPPVIHHSKLALRSTVPHDRKNIMCGTADPEGPG